MKYTKDLLESILHHGGALALEEYSRYNQRMSVRFRCMCGTETSKRFEMLHVHRCPYCPECSKKINLERRNATWLQKYGVSNIFQKEGIREKINETFEQKYGDHPKRTHAVQEKWKQTCLEKYGGHPNQNPEVQAKAEKNSYRHKDYTMPCGTIVKVQGYEDKALNELLECFTEDEIILGRGNVPRIRYVCSESVNRIYYPDFYIQPLNTILEIKSEWTLKLNTCRLEEKAKAVIAAGYTYEVWVYDGPSGGKRTLAF
jgi:hypothetical protein